MGRILLIILIVGGGLLSMFRNVPHIDGDSITVGDIYKHEKIIHKPFDYQYDISYFNYYIINKRPNPFSYDLIKVMEIKGDYIKYITLEDLKKDKYNINTYIDENDNFVNDTLTDYYKEYYYKYKSVYDFSTSSIYTNDEQKYGKQSN